MAVATETLQHHELPITEPSRLDAFEGSGIPTEDEHFESVWSGTAVPIVPGLTEFKPDMTEMMSLNNLEVEKQKKITDKVASVVISVAERYKRALLASGAMLEDAEAAFNEVISDGFQAVTEHKPRLASRALSEPIYYIVDSRKRSQFNH